MLRSSISIRSEYIQWVIQEDMGQGASSGQVVTIENRTPFGLRAEVDPAIVCGTEVNTPNEIPSLLQNESESPMDLRNVPNMHLENRGKHSSSYGSEIQYTYRFEGTPGDDEWFSKIWSIGAYKSENACFAARVQKSRGKIFMAQTSWRNTAIHGEHNPDKRDDIGTNADCFFQLSISAVIPLPDKGDFYVVPLRITMKPIVVANVISGKEVEISRSVISTQSQTLLPGGSDTVSNEFTRETHMISIRTMDKSWGREYSYTNEIQLGFDIGKESQVKVGDAKADGGEATTKTKGSFHFGYGFTSQIKEMNQSSEKHQTQTVTKNAQSYSWTFVKNVKKQETVKIEITKVTYQQEFTDKNTGAVVATKERYVYFHEASIEPSK